MPLIVFLRGANVGGHQVFRPAQLAKELGELDVVSIGAAGTFVVRGKTTQAAIRAEFQRRLPFRTESMICEAREVLALAAAKPFDNAPPVSVANRYVTICGKRVTRPPKLPLDQPSGGDWKVRIIAVSGRFILTLCRRSDKPGHYPNEFVEKTFSVPATTRNWNTIEAICKAI